MAEVIATGRLSLGTGGTRTLRVARIVGNHRVGRLSHPRRLALAFQGGLRVFSAVAEGCCRARGALPSRPRSLLPPIRPGALARLQPPQVGLQAQHDAFEQQPGVGAIRFGHRRALDVSEPANQLTTLCVDDADRIGQLRCRGGVRLS